MVWYDMHFRASSPLSTVKAFVGHESRHFLQVPHRFLIGSSYSNSVLIISTPIKQNEPSVGLISILFFPIHPNLPAVPTGALEQEPNLQKTMLLLFVENIFAELLNNPVFQLQSSSLIMV